MARSSYRTQRGPLPYARAFSALVLTLGGCRGETPRFPELAQDSTGIEILESLERTWAEGKEWIVDPAPILDLTRPGTGETHEFYGVTDATRLPDGTIAVSQGAEIRLFSATGEHIRTVGGKGEGPGEFYRVDKLGLLQPDSLIAFDQALRRITVFGRESEVGRVSRVEADYMRRDRFEVLGREFILMTQWPSLFADDAPWGVVRTPVVVVAASALGELRDTICTAAGYESFRFQEGEGWSDSGALFGKDSHLGVRDGSIIVGDADDLSYRVLNPAGNTVQIVKGRPDLSLTQSLLDAERKAYLGSQPRPSKLNHLNRLPVPDRRPGYRNLKVDATGHVWLEEHRGEWVHRKSAEPRFWEVFAPNGAWLGRVSVPGRFSILEIGAQFILGVRSDELGVESVQMLALKR